MSDCEICGKPSLDLFVVSIDGVRMTVCKDCSHYGTFVNRVEVPRAVREERVLEGEVETELVPDYAQLIAGARQKKGVDQKEFARSINETLNVIKKVEAGAFKPTEKLAKKLEAALGIRLFEQIKREKLTAAGKAEGGQAMTLGDVVVLKKK